MKGTLITSKTVLAGDPPAPVADALVVMDGRVAWTGDLRQAPRGAWRRVDLGEAVVGPGFVDPHHHFATRVMLARSADVSLERTAAGVATRMWEESARVPDGVWVVAQGCRELVGGLERRLTRRDLDAAVPDRPALVIHSSYHSGVANSAALEAVGFGRRTPRWPAGELERDLRGEPTGRAWEAAFGVLENAAHRAELDALGAGWAERARSLAVELLAEGITHVGDAAMRPREIAMARESALPVGFTAMPCSPRGFYARPDDALEGARTGEGDDRFRIGPLKLFADGGERCAMRIPLRVAARAVRLATGGGRDTVEAMRVISPRFKGGWVHTGTLHYSREDMAELCGLAVENGFGVAVHALGNEGIEVALAALGSSGAEGARIEHAMFATPGQTERMARMGVTAVVQPGHLISYGAFVASTGIDRYLPPVPLRRLLDAGVRVAFGSDAPTAVWKPLEILRAAVERRTQEGARLAPEQAAGRDEAFRAATSEAARAAGVGDSKGAILPGRLADLAVLSGDPFDPATRVVETWVAGERVFGGT